MEDKSAQFFSLQEATKYCEYSQEYLSLRARQGKLKAAKFGRNWVTKKEWLDDYLGHLGPYKVKMAQSVQMQNEPPENLPIETEKNQFKIVTSFFANSAFYSRLFLMIIAVLVIEFMMIGNSFLAISDLASSVGETVDTLYQYGSTMLVNEVPRNIGKVNFSDFGLAAMQNIVLPTLDVFGEYFQWLGASIGNIL